MKFRARFATKNTKAGYDGLFAVVLLFDKDGLGNLAAPVLRDMPEIRHS